MQWNNQSGSINTNLKVNIDFTLHKLSETKIAMCSFYIDDSAKVRYDIILG